MIAAALIFGTLVSVTSTASLGATPLLLGVLISAGVLVAYARVRLPRPGRFGWVFDLVVIALVVLAVPDLVVFRNPVGIPGIYFDPGIVQFQQDYILGPTNQLLGGGALLVNDPVSQYGVGLDLLRRRLVPPGADRLRHVRLPRLAADRAVLRRPATRCCGWREFAGCWRPARSRSAC